MIDCDAALRSYLAGQANLVALAGARIYASPDSPPGVTPALGSILLFNARGGQQDYSSKVLSPSYQFRSIAATEEAASDLNRALYDALNDQRPGHPMLYARLEGFPVLLIDPETLWPFVLSFYIVIFSN